MPRTLSDFPFRVQALELHEQAKSLPEQEVLGMPEN